MAEIRWVAVLAIIGLLVAAAAAAVDAGSSTAAVAGGGLSLEFHAASCPQLESIVRAAVKAERDQDVQLTAGLLRIFFHDCLPQGCDASILLVGEKDVGPNLSLQQRALNLIETIRGKVHAVCGATVSCADIIALATRDAVSLAGGPSIAMPLGRSDSSRPATISQIGILPGPDTDVGTLLNKFRNKGLADAADLVSLSGGHTVGKASCGFIRGNDRFSKDLAANCSSGRTKKQSLDIITPDAFDNKYFVALTNNQGVFLSDQGLAGDQRTRSLVTAFASNQAAFFDQFAKSFVKLGNLKGDAPGKIRNNCFTAKTTTNGARGGGSQGDDNNIVAVDNAAVASNDEGFAASA